MEKQKSVLREVKSKVISLASNEIACEVFGPNEAHLLYLAQNIPVVCKSRGLEVTLQGSEEQIQMAEKCILFLSEIAQRTHVQKSDVADCLRSLVTRHDVDIRHVLQQNPIITPKKRVAPRTLAQKRYIEAIGKYDIVFGVGPAGTGKTYLAMALAVHQLVQGKIQRIILTRPAVEAGEKLGFLPGDLAEKVNPYLRPLLDALNDMLEPERVERLMATGQIEVAPIAFMRGRTLNDSYVILDEAQNCTREQMKMFLTRLGENSRAVITGDVTQIDLPHEKKSGLIQALKILNKIEGITIHKFDDRDVVRHALVAEVIRAYDRAEKIP